MVSNRDARWSLTLSGSGDISWNERFYYIKMEVEILHTFCVGAKMFQYGFSIKHFFITTFS